ncbi:hypothetical protein RON38_02195 [Lactobacillus mulieris]|uniref:hypothetical protein n=1 Tax=Lactobacillus mulieris TaxID=2508708 RepID=UPI00254F717B|nr:hypothetical protein [Lactobacillus mulieris]MDK6803875.1 hypothetical protein [Lactobacillus mulieris]MDT9620323.1 hypothetical protein [Lactobacillus mulieris]
MGGVNTPYTGSVTLSNVTAPSAGTTIKDFKSSLNLAAASTTGNAHTVAGGVTVYYAGTNTKVDDNVKFVAGVSYRVTATVSVTELTPNAHYKFNGTTYQADASGTVNGIVVNAPAFRVIDSSIEGNPYFATKSGVSIANGDTLGENVTSDANTAKVLAQAINSVIFNANSSQDQGVITTTAADIATQLSNQGITVDKNGNFTNPENGFYIVLTGMNKKNGKTATVKIAFNGKAADYSKYPVIKLNDVKKAQGKETTNVTTDKFTVANGAKFDPVNPNGMNITAQQNSTNTNTLDIKALSNPVNTKVAGDYTVTVYATNVDGLTTQYSYKVTVKAADKSADNLKTIHYTAGYGVNIWSMQSAGQRAFTGNRAMAGDSYYTFDTKTVDGIEFTRISKNKDGKNDNTWVPSEYLSDNNSASETTTDTKTDENAETYLRGSLVVTYNGGGKVRLLNSEGQWQDQYVEKGKTFKVWGKKMINGKLMYRIGTQSQWIPAMYVQYNG